MILILILMLRGNDMIPILVGKGAETIFRDA